VEADAAGFTKGKRLSKIGWRSQDTAELFFTDCRIPRQNRLGRKGTGFKNLMTNLQQERLICSIGAQTAAEFILKETIRYCKGRQMFGKPLTGFQNTQFVLAEMATEVKIAWPTIVCSSSVAMVIVKNIRLQEHGETFELHAS
jgi:acyl-CoA dehydrogenase